jgi:ribosomal protein L11 methyltransferase
VLRSTLQQRLPQLRQYGINCGSGRISISRVPKEDWAESWKRHFKPFIVGSALLVKPSWSQRKPIRNQQVVVIDPGLSFGTGQHPTTRFCLQQLVNARDPHSRQSFLDVGTGSGILAIAAAKLEYAPVEAFDFDPAAVRVAKENANKNRVRVNIRPGDITKPGHTTPKYDVICANLTADLLASCARTLKSLLKSDGLLLLAGILRAQMPEVLQHYEKIGFLPQTTAIDGEWASLVLHKRG